MPFLAREELLEMGFRDCGIDIRISDRCSIYGAEHISLGDHVRIDDMTVITAAKPVQIGSYVHISAQAFISATDGCRIGDFVNISVGATIFTNSDDFSGEHLVGALMPDDLRELTRGAVTIGRHGIVGARSVVMPGVDFGEGAAVGALSFVKTSLAPWGIYAGIPARLVKARSRKMLELEADWLSRHSA